MQARNLTRKGSNGDILLNQSRKITSEARWNPNKNVALPFLLCIFPYTTIVAKTRNENLNRKVRTPRSSFKEGLAPDHRASAGGPCVFRGTQEEQLLLQGAEDDGATASVTNIARANDLRKPRAECSQTREASSEGIVQNPIV